MEGEKRCCAALRWIEAQTETENANRQGQPRPSSTTRRFGLGPWTTHEEVFEDELPLASFERGIASAAYDLAIRQRACLGTNKLVLGMAVWAVEAGRFWHRHTFQ
jgi:hypothetical protein